jgi:hypothetical protein
VPNVPLALEWFWSKQMVHLGDEAQVEAHSDLFGDSPNLNAR